MKMIAIRLKPNQDLKLELEKIVKDQNITSGFIATCVGSAHVVTLRMAGAKPEKQDIRKLEGHFEIVSLVGTISLSGTHLHLSVSDEEGNVIGGHLKEGTLVTTTAEVVIGYEEGITFERALDQETGFEELSVVSTPLEQFAPSTVTACYASDDPLFRVQPIFAIMSSCRHED